MDMSSRNDRPCADCQYAEPWPDTPWQVCAEADVVEALGGKRHCGEIARHDGPCGTQGAKYRPKRKE